MDHIKKKAGYEYLLAYKLTIPIYDYTVIFCKRCQSANYPDFPQLSSPRTFDQMVQASRSGSTNLAEGNQQTSLEGYIKLTGVNKASLEELLKDYLSYARQNGIEVWGKEETVRKVKELGEVWEILNKTPTLPDSPNFPNLPNSPDKAVNLMITLINQAIYLQKKLKESLEKKFIHEGGFRENLFKKRLEEKKKDWQKGFLKLTKSTLISLLILTTLTFGTGLIYLFGPWTKPTEAVWFDDNWAYRKAITFTHNAAVSTPSQVVVEVDTTAAPDSFQADCGDVRFTDPSGNLLRYYHNPGGGAGVGCDDASSNFDVLMPTIINGLNLIYMYYGNPNARDGTESADFSEATTTPSGGAPSAGTEANAPSPRLYWKFDVFTTITGDSTINLLHGTLNNTPTIKTEDFCVAGKCLYFDGANDENVSRADNALLDFVAADNFTVSAWVKRNGASSANNVIINKASGNIGTTFQGYKLYMDTDGDFCFETRDGTLGLDQACSSSANFDDDKWHLVQGVKSGTASITLYVDGKQRAQDATIDSTGSLANADTFYVGADSDVPVSEWLGYIDEVKVYPQARSAAQIQADFNARSNNEGAAQRFGVDPNNQFNALNNGLAGYWKMDESDWTNDCTATSVTDSSGNANNGKSCPLTTGPDPVAGKFGNAGNFDGTDDFVSIADNPVYELTNFSLSAWVNFDVLPSTRAETAMIAAKIHSVSPFYTYQFYVNSSMQLCLQWNNTVPTNYVQCTTVSMNTGTWYHVAATKEGEFLKVFLNGADITGTATSATGTAFASDGVLSLGAFDATNSRTDGKIDETRVYNRALTSADITNLYNFGPPPVGYWNFDEKTDVTAYDYSGLQNNGTLTNGPTFTNGKFGAGINFSSSTTDNDHVIRADDPDFDFIAGASFSWETYFKHAQTSTLQVMMVKHAEAGYFLIMEADGDITCLVDDDAAAGYDDSVTSTLATYDDNAWHHAACVKDGTSSLKLYIDGVLIGSDASLTETGTLVNTDPLYFGTSVDGASFDWVGQLDEPKIYNYARTQAQVIEDVNAGHPAPGSPVGSSVAYWKFDEGYSTTANDSNSQNGSEDLTLNTASWTNSGKFNKAWNGTGGDIRMSRATDADLEFAATESFTISTWFKTDSATNPVSGIEYLVSTTTDNTDVGYAIYANTDGTICFGIDDDITWGPDVSSCTTTDFYDGNWHFLTALRDTTAVTTRIYIDAISRDSDTDTTTATLDGDNTFFVGDVDTDNNATAGIEEFAGDIDEMKVYRSALTAEQVKLDMNRGASQVLGALGTAVTGRTINDAASEYCPPGNTETNCAASSNPAPVGRWDFEEGSGSTARDTNGGATANDGTITGATYASGKQGKALNFNGSTDTVTVSNTISTKTVEFWVNPSTTTENLMDLRTAATAASISVSSGTISAAGFTTPTIYVNGIVTSTLAANTWQYVSVTTGTAISASAIQFGRISSTSLTGKLDSIRFFDYARSASQIAWDYNRGGPVGHWKMDECQGITINDSSGNSSAGTLTIGASGEDTVGTCQTSSTAWGSGVTGKRNYSLSFDGTDDYVDIGNNSLYNLTSAMTLAAWINPTSLSPGNFADIISRTNTSSNGYEFYMTGTSPHISFCSNGAGCQAGSNNTISFNTWQHVAAVVNGTSLQFYVNGRTAGSATISAISSSTSNLYIGKLSDNTLYFPGQIDDARIYNYPLTATQVKNVMNDGATRFGPVTGAP